MAFFRIVLLKNRWEPKFLQQSLKNLFSHDEQQFGLSIKVIFEIIIQVIQQFFNCMSTPFLSEKIINFIIEKEKTSGAASCIKLVNKSSP